MPEGDARGVYLDIHGGGFYLGSASMGDIRNARCAETLHVAVVSVEYRLAPEHPWPAGPTTARRPRTGCSTTRPTSSAPIAS